MVDELCYLRPPFNGGSLPKTSIPCLFPPLFGSLPPYTTWIGLGLSNPPTYSSISILTTFSSSLTHLMLSAGSPTLTSSPILGPQPDTHITSSTVVTSTAQFSYFSLHPDNFHYHTTFKPIPKIDLPHFTGRETYGWIGMTEGFLNFYCVSPEQLVSTASCQFDENTSKWMSWYEQKFPTIDWAFFIDVLLQCFGPSEKATHVEATLSHLLQTRSVDEYRAQFTLLACHASNWIDQQLMSVFISGLKDEIIHDVIALKPTSLIGAFNMPRNIENKLKARHSFHKNLSPRPTSTFHNPTYSTRPFSPSSRPPPSFSFPSQPRSITTPPPSTSPYRHWSRAESNDRRACGLCFFFFVMNNTHPPIIARDLLLHWLRLIRARTSFMIALLQLSIPTVKPLRLLPFMPSLALIKLRL